MAGRYAADQLLGDRYALVEVLGHGASGAVWRARDQLLQRDVAVKEIKFPVDVGDSDDAAFRDAILREARAAARLNHPGAVTVYDVVEEGGMPLIVMELVDAPTLTQVVEANGPLPPQEVAGIGLQLLEALDAGHAAGIVHRDVKPGNVMVGEGRVWLADFGVAAVIDEVRLTSANAVIGSPAYMAPEQVTGEAIGRPADIWGLGATLYFAVEGRPPFDKGSVIPTMTAIVREPHRPAARAGIVGPVLEALLVKDPDSRPTAAFLRLWLADLADGESLAGSNDRDGTTRFSLSDRVEVEDIEVPGPQQPPGGPLAPGPVSPGGPEIVVIPKPTPSEVPPPGPTVPTPSPAPGPSPSPPPDTSPTPPPEQVPPEQVPPDPGPERVPPEPDTNPDPLRIPSEPDPLLVPPEPDPLTTPPAPTQPSGPVARSRAPWLVAGTAALVAVVVVAALLGGRGDGGGEGAGDTQPAPSGAVASANVPADWVRYADPTTGFTIPHPPGWEMVVDGSLTDFRDPATGAYLRIDHVQPPGPSPEGAWLAFEPRFAADHGGYQRVRIEPTTYAGFPAAIWEYTYGGEGARLRAVDLGFVTADYGFALNFQAPESEWNRLQPVFEAFKASFRAPAP